MLFSLNFWGFPMALLQGVNVNALVTSWTEKNQSVGLVGEALRGGLEQQGTCPADRGVLGTVVVVMN